MRTTTRTHPAATRRTTAARPKKRATDTTPVDNDEAALGPEPPDDEIAADLDPVALEEVAEPEVAATKGPQVVEEAPDEELVVEEAVPTETDTDDEEVEPDLGTLITGMLALEEVAAAEEDEREPAAPEFEFVPAAQPNEFAWSGCFLIWNRRRLADPERRLCQDCADDLPAAAPSPATAA